MRILHIIGNMSLAHGGPPQVVANLAEAQSEIHDVAIASYSTPQSHDQVKTSKNIHIATLGPPDVAEKWFGLRSTLALKKLIEDADVVHMHCVWETVLTQAGRTAKKLSKPYIVTPHGMLDPWSMTQKRLKKNIALKLGRRKLLEQAEFIHVLNHEEEIGIRQLGINNRCVTIPNGVALEKIDPLFDNDDLASEFPGLPEQPFILFMSRLHYKKGLDILADAAKSFFEKNPQWMLVVAGPDGGARAEFEERIKVHKLESHVQIIGPVYGPAKFRLLARCEIFCLPSRQEGFSVAILEALAASKPVVITHNCHFDEVGETESGVVKRLNPAEIATALCELATSSDRRTEMGKNGRRLVEQKYTWNRVSQMFSREFFQF